MYQCIYDICICAFVLLFLERKYILFLLVTDGLHPSQLILFLQRKFTSSFINYLTGPAAGGMKTDWLSFISALVQLPTFPIYSLVFILPPSREQLPTRTWTRKRQGPSQRGRAAPQSRTTSHEWHPRQRKAWIGGW